MANIPSVEDFNSSAQFKVAQWSRNTVADGVWLQKNTIGPLKDRDDFILSLLNDLGNSDSWKQWSENHNSTAQFPEIASAIYIGPNNEILDSGHAYVVGENNRVVATTNTATYSRGGSYVFGMDNYVNDGFVIGNQVTALEGSKVFGRDVSAIGCSTIIGYNSSAKEGSLILNTPRASDHNSYAEGGSIILGTDASAVGGSLIISTPGGTYKNSMNIAGGGSLVLGAENGDNYAYGGSIAIGKNLTANSNGLALGTNAKAEYGAVSIGFDRERTNAYAKDGSIAIGNASAMAGSFGLGLKNGENVKANNNGFVIGNKNIFAEYLSFVFGYENISARSCAFSFGNKNIYSYGNAIAMGGENLYAAQCAVVFGNNNSATNCAFAFGDGNTVKANFAFGLNNSAVASTLENYYILSAERDSNGKPILTGTAAVTSVSSKVYEPHGFVVGDNNISQTYSPIIIGVANSAALSGGFGEIAHYDTTGYMVPNYPIAIGIGNKAYRNFDTTIGSYNIADGGSNLVYGDWCSAVGNRNTILNGYNSVVIGKDNLILGSDSKLLVYTNDGLINSDQGFNHTTENILYWSKINATIKFEDSWICENILRKSDFDISATEDRTFFTNNKINESKIDIKNDDYDIWFCGNEITGGNVNVNTNQYTMFNYNKIRLGNKAENTLNIPECSEHQIYITNNNIDYYGPNGKTFNIITPYSFNFNDFKYTRSINLPDNVNIFNVKTNHGFVIENNIYQTVFDINLSAKHNYDTSEFVSFNNLLFTKFICNIDKFKQYNLPRFYMNGNTPTLDGYKLAFTNSYVFGGSILNSDRVISFATEYSLSNNDNYTTISNSNNIINLGDDNEISASIETVSFGKMNNIVGGHKTTIFGNENIAYITPVEVDNLVTNVESYTQYSGMLPGLYDTNIIGSYNSFMSDVVFDRDNVNHANTIARNFILGYHNDLKVHNFITDNVIIGNNNKTVYESDNYSNQLYRNKIIGNNNSASNQFADCNILGDNNEFNNNSEIVFENDTIIGMHNKVEFGSNSTLIGHHNIVSGYNSVLIGEGLSATNSQVVVGRFNEVLPGTDDRDGQTTTSGALFIVGNGSHTDDDFDTPNRSNAMVVSADGTVSAKTYKADPGTPLGKLFDFVETLTNSTTGNLQWDGDNWSIHQ